MALHQGADEAKDQSYFLALTAHKPSEKRGVSPCPRPQERGSCRACGVGAFGSPSSREPGNLFCARRRLPRLPQGDRRASSRRGADGPARRACRGQARRLWQYTEGQRRGLGVSWTEPLYVIGKDRSRNALLLGTADELPVNACAAGELNFLVPPELWPHELRVRTRYRQKAVPADIRLVGGGESGMDATARMLIRFHQPQLPSAPGQLAAVFDEHGHVLAGGIICKER